MVRSLFIVWQFPCLRKRTGWLCRIKPSEMSEMEELLDAKAYQAHCEGEDAIADKH